MSVSVVTGASEGIGRAYAFAVSAFSDTMNTSCVINVNFGIKLKILDLESFLIVQLLFVMFYFFTCA